MIMPIDSCLPIVVVSTIIMIAKTHVTIVDNVAPRSDINQIQCPNQG